MNWKLYPFPFGSSKLTGQDPGPAFLCKGSIAKR